MCFFCSSRRRHTRSLCDWSSDVCSSDLQQHAPRRERRRGVRQRFSLRHRPVADLGPGRMSDAGAAGSGVGSPARIDRQTDAGGRSARRIRGIPGGGTCALADERRADRSGSRLHTRGRTPERGCMRIWVVGAGAVGGLTGAWFAKAGHEVSLVARGAHLEAIRGRGLTLISGGKPEVHAVRVSSEPADFGVQDAVFVCLKTYSIAAMLPRLKSLVGPETTVVPAINGLPWWYFHKEGGRFDGQSVARLDPGGRMLSALDPKHVLGCVVHAAAQG